MKGRAIALLEKDSGRDALKRACRKAKVSIGTIEALVEAELEQVGKLRKRGLWERFDEVLSEDVDEEGAS